MRTTLALDGSEQSPHSWVELIVSGPSGRFSGYPFSDRLGGVTFSMGGTSPRRPVYWVHHDKRCQRRAQFPGITQPRVRPAAGRVNLLFGLRVTMVDTRTLGVTPLGTKHAYGRSMTILTNCLSSSAIAGSILG
jgi:hypothetical protein